MGGLRGMADSRAKKEVAMGELMHWPDIVTPAGIRQAYPLHSRAPTHLSWSRQAIRGLTFLETEDASCVCDGWTPQNAAHLCRCPWVGDGVGRSREQARGDEKWCEAVARFVS